MPVQFLRKPVIQMRQCLARAAACTRGVAAIEFGMIVPIMFMLFVGAIEFSLAITVDRRVTADHRHQYPGRRHVPDHPAADGTL
jgi:uncharacterized membrane protein